VSDALRLGVVGPEDFVTRIIETSPMKLPDIPAFQLVATSYEHEQETLRVIERVRDDVDGFLFTGPVPYDIARSVGHLDVPSAYIPLNGTSLYGSLLAGTVHSSRFDPMRISVDTLTQAEVNEAYAELDLPVQHVLVRPYDAATDSSEMVEFHLEMRRELGTTGALTGLRSVYELLRASEVPVMRMVPTAQATRTALRVAVLLASGARGSESRIVAAVIAIGSGGGMLDLEALTGKWGDSLLSAQQVVREHARRVGALATPLSPSRMLVVGTVEAGDTLFEGMSTNPFNDEIKKSTGLDCTVGVGTSYDAAAAFDAAVAALKACATQDAGHGCVVLEDGMIVSLGEGRPGRHPQPPASLGAAELRYVGQLREAFLTADRPDPEATDIEGSPIVAAEEVATVLSITPRSARRFMDSLVAAGVAWALPPVKSPQPGRPRRRWRIDLAGARWSSSSPVWAATDRQPPP